MIERPTIDGPNGFHGSHILFISADHQNRSNHLLLQLEDDGVLTAGETDDFLERGGMIRLALRERRVALEVSLNSASRARIDISSKLFALARVVRGKRE